MEFPEIHWIAESSVLHIQEVLNKKKILLVASKKFSESEYFTKISLLLSDRISCVKFKPQGLVSDTDFLELYSSLRNFEFDSVLSIGGGSTIDVGKLLSCFLHQANGFKLESFLESKKFFENDVPALPHFVIPTLAGSGSEMTPFAVLWDKRQAKKLSFCSLKMIPKTVFIMPELARSLSWSNVLYSGLDSFTHCFDSLWNKNTNSRVYEFANGSILRTLHSLPILKDDLNDAASMRQMFEASILAGKCISHTQTSLCHSISYPLTAKLGMPHGLACAFAVPEVLKLYGQNFEVIHQLSGDLGVVNATELAKLVASFYDKLEVAQHVLRFVKDRDQVMALNSEMIYAGRIENFAESVNELQVKNLMKSLFESPPYRDLH